MVSHGLAKVYAQTVPITENVDSDLSINVYVVLHLALLT